MERGLFFLFIIVSLLMLILILTRERSYEIFEIVKPVTFLQYSLFLGFCFGLEILRPWVEKIDRRIINLFIIFGFFCIMAVLFEVFWVFGYWFANYQLNVLENGAEMNAKSLDSVTYLPSLELSRIYDNQYEDISLNRSAKKNILFFLMSIYWVYFMHSIKN
ncbi:MAG: hypothetical protein Q7S27_02840 [Nanoarchaeota archaeon]|nr:hypothetical protein [Nanoarchaeota archaeon]